MDKNQEYILVELIGKNPIAFNRLFEKLTKTIEEALEDLTKEEITQSTRETISDLATVAKDFIQAKINKPSIENQKLLSEIASEYAEVEQKLANARKARAEAESIEIENASKKLESAFEIISLFHRLKIYYDESKTNQFIDASKRKD